MCFEYDVPNDFLSAKVQVARKPHRCGGCRAEISVGEEHEYLAGKCDGSFFQERICRTCKFDQLRIAASELDAGCQWHEAWCPISELSEYVRESGMERVPVPEWFSMKVPEQVTIKKLRTINITENVPYGGTMTCEK